MTILVIIKIMMIMLIKMTMMKMIMIIVFQAAKLFSFRVTWEEHRYTRGSKKRYGGKSKIQISKQSATDCHTHRLKQSWT